MNRLLAAALFAAAARCGWPQDAGDLLRRVSETYANANSYELSGSMTLRIAGVPEIYHGQIRIAQAGPSLTPPETGLPMLPQIVFAGGNSYWTDSEGRRVPPPKLSFALPGPRSFSYTRLGKGRLAGEETLEIAGRKAPCRVVEIPQAEPGDAPQRVWIDKTRNVIVQQAFSAEGRLTPEKSRALNWTITFDSIKLNEPPPQWLIDAAVRLNADNPAWVGRPAPDFTLADLNGKRVRLSDLRGKVVLLDFWATWCGPCNEEMAILEKLRAELGGKGVEFWGVADEAADKALAWLKKNGRSLPTLIDAKEVFQKYGVKSVPVLVIVDRAGNVASYVNGLRSERALVAALRKAGLEL